MLQVKSREDGRVELLAEFRYGTYVVPAGFAWDGLSYPRELDPMCIRRYWVPSYDPRTLAASCLHDYLYLCARRHQPLCTRSVADRMFRDLLRDSGISRRVRWQLYLAVRLGGRAHWTS